MIVSPFSLYGMESEHEYGMIGKSPSTPSLWHHETRFVEKSVSTPALYHHATTAEGYNGTMGRKIGYLERSKISDPNFTKVDWILRFSGIGADGTPLLDNLEYLERGDWLTILQKKFVKSNIADDKTGQKITFLLIGTQNRAFVTQLYHMLVKRKNQST